MSIFIFAGTYQVRAGELDPAVEEYVKQIVLHSYLGKISDVTRQIATTQNIDIVPQIAQAAIYEVGFEAFNNYSLNENIRHAYQNGFRVARESMANKSPTAEVDIKRAVDKFIDPLISELTFQKLVEEVINRTLAQQQMMMQQANAQRMVQEMILRQKVMEEAIKQQFEAAYQEAYQNQLKESGVFTNP